jgi:hypothetical protein
MARRVGLDIGDVLSRREEKGTERDRTKEPWQTVDDGAYPFCLIYAANFGADKLNVVSRTNCGIKWNKHGNPLWIQRFINALGLHAIGMPDDNFALCVNHNEKGDICTRLGVTDFVDNHPWCLESVASTETNVRLFHYHNKGHGFKPSWHSRWHLVTYRHDGDL